MAQRKKNGSAGNGDEKKPKKGRRPRGVDENKWSTLDDRVVVAACMDVLAGETMQTISERIWDRFKVYVDRVQVNKVLAEAGKRRILHLLAPKHDLLSQRMLDCFGAPRTSVDGESRKHKTIEVVKYADEPSLDHVANVAAAMTFDVIQEKFKTKKAHSRSARKKTGVEPGEGSPYVHVGIGAGTTVRLIARGLAARFRAENHPPPVMLHALSSGFLVDDPTTAPNAFFSFFDEIEGVRYKGLFSKPYVTTEEWKRACHEEVGVCEAANGKRDIDIIVTALASAQDDHGELNRWMGEYSTYAHNTSDRLREEGRVGDVMYRPFNPTGPIELGNEIRAASLFELEELVEFAARPDTAVILVAGPCGSRGCGRSRDDALYPLLTEPALDVWTHLVTDVVTAENVLSTREALIGAPTASDDE